jgi:hypothetical protein
LERSKLDVVWKTRSNLFGWRGQFTPDFVGYLLDEIKDDGGWVLDPFCGSGTVLQECAVRNRPVCGGEINPAAHAMARFFTFSKMTLDERESLAQRVQDIVRAEISEFSDLALFNQTEVYRERVSNLLDLGRLLLAQASDDDEMTFLLLILFEAEDSRFPELSQAVFTALTRLTQHLFALPFTSAPVEVALCDARETHGRALEWASLVLTSPPYINVFNYHQNHRAILELLGYDLLSVASSEMGSNRKNRGNRFKTIIQYALDMESGLASFAHSLKPDGTLALVVGRESNVRGMAVPNSRLVENIVLGVGGFSRLGTFERCFKNRFGSSIVEDILLFRRTAGCPVTGAARKIARAVLEDLAKRVVGEIAEDVQDALSGVDAITESPVFSSCRSRKHVYHAAS